MSLDTAREQVEDDLADLKSAITTYRRKHGRARSSAAERVKDATNEAKRHMRIYKDQIESLSGVGAGAPASSMSMSMSPGEADEACRFHEKKYRGFFDRFKELRTDFRRIEKASDREDLFDGAGGGEPEEDEVQVSRGGRRSSYGSGGGTGGVVEEVDEEDNLNDALAKRLFSDVYAVQDENLQIVIQLCGKADKANEMAAEINEKLAGQNEQLVRISGELDSLQDQIKAAGHELRSFMRGIATDKCMLVCCLLICVIILVVVVLLIVCKAGVCKIACKAITTPENCKKIPGFLT